MTDTMPNHLAQPGTQHSSPAYCFTHNDPYDRNAAIELVVPRLLGSRAFMQSIRAFTVPEDGIALWFLGQNGYIVKDPSGLLIGIDLYLTDSCAATFGNLAFRVNRQLPVFIEPEDLEIDAFLTTHSHQDHADPETIRRVSKGNTIFIGPFDSMRIFEECEVPKAMQRLVHPGETLRLSNKVTMQSTFALPTDDTDLNHTGVVLELANGIRYCNSGDTAYFERLASLLPKNIDVLSICINGGFHNLAPMQAAEIVKKMQPRVVIPCHYDMMINNVGSPEMFRAALDIVQSTAKFQMLRYYEPWVYRRESADPKAAGHAPAEER
jgi:L-ascorbate 6-phosphate lactonase